MKIQSLMKKILIFSITMAIPMANASFNVLNTYAESDTTVSKSVSNETVNNAAVYPKKAIYMDSDAVTGRNNADESDNSNITDYQEITDLMIDADVTSIPSNKFRDLKNLTTLTFKSADTNSKVVTIGAEAFKGSGITSVILPKKLRSIEGGAFADNEALASVSFEHSTNLEQIKTGAFENCALRTVDLTPINGSSASSLSVEGNAFRSNRNLTTVELSSKMNRITEGTFENTGLTGIEIVQSIRDVSPLAFTGAPLATLTVASGHTSLEADKNVLYNTGKTKLILYPEGKTETEFTLPDTVTRIEAAAFNASPLTKVITNANLTHIGRGAFNGSSKLAEVILKNNLTQIGEYAFQGTSVATVKLIGRIVGIEQNAFAGAAKLTTLDLRQATQIASIKKDAFKNSALDSMLVSENTGSLNSITANAFNSTATKRSVFFIDDGDNAITGGALAALQAKYAKLKEAANGAWIFGVKLPNPAATVDYTTMKLKDLVANAVYTIQSVDYTADEKGQIPLLKAWGGNKISIVQKAATAGASSEAQFLDIDKLYSVNLNGKEHSLQKVNASVTVTAAERDGYQFAEWKATGVDLGDKVTQKIITFEMPGSDVELTPTYKKLEDPKPEGPKPEDPKPEDPKPEDPKPEGPKPQDPKPENPKPQDPKPEAPQKPSMSFPDIKPNDWYYGAVNYITSNNIMKGYADGSFGPANNLGRGQFATILYRMEGSPAINYESTFPDVSVGQFYSLPAVWANNNKIITGYSNGMFGISDSITREQLATILYRYKESKGEDVSARADLNRFPDAGNVSSFAKDAISWAVAERLISGDQGKLNPQGESSRAVTATIIQRYQGNR